MKQQIELKWPIGLQQPPLFCRVFGAVVFTALSLGRASSFAPDASKAQASASRILSLLRRKPVIDATSPDGQKLVCLTYCRVVFLHTLPVYSLDIIHTLVYPLHTLVYPLHTLVYVYSHTILYVGEDHRCYCS